MEILLGSCHYLSLGPGLLSFRSQLSYVAPDYMIWFLSYLLRTLAKGWFHQHVIYYAHCITCSLLILSSLSFPYLLVMMFWLHLLLHNWNFTERGALWTTMKIHKIHQNIIFKYKKTQFRLGDIWHQTSVIAFAASTSVLGFLYFVIFTVLCPFLKYIFSLINFLVYFWSSLFHV